MKNKKLTIIQESVLAQIPLGIGSNVQSKEIAERTGLSKRDVMAVISTLIIDHNIPIGAGRSEGRYGYFRITNENERIEAIVPLKNTVITMQQRIDCLEKMKI